MDTKYKDNIVQKVGGKSEIVVGVWGEEEEVWRFSYVEYFLTHKILLNRGPVGRVEKRVQKDKIVEFKWYKDYFFCTLHKSTFRDKYNTLLNIFP